MCTSGEDFLAFQNRIQCTADQISFLFPMLLPLQQVNNCLPAFVAAKTLFIGQRKAWKTSLLMVQKIEQGPVILWAVAWGDKKCQNFAIETEIKSLYRDSCGWYVFSPSCSIRTWCFCIGICMEAHAPGSVAWVQSGKFTSVVVTTKSTRLHFSETLVSRIRKKKLISIRRQEKINVKMIGLSKALRK